MFGNSGPSLADIAAVTDGNRNNDGMGYGGGMWWAWVLLIVLFGGFGGGYGWNNRGAAGAAYADEAVIQRALDTQSVIQKLDGINSGICSLGYDQLNQMNGINNTILTSGFATQQAVNNNTVAGMQNTNALSRQLADCCCENRQAVADLKYTMATDTCAVTTAIERAAQSIMQNDNANYRQLHDEQVAIQMQALKEKNAEQASLIQSLNLAASQANQNQFFQGQLENLYNRLNPCAQPAYVVPNPNCCYPNNGWPYVNTANEFNGGCCNRG